MNCSCAMIKGCFNCSKVSDMDFCLHDGVCRYWTINVKRQGVVVKPLLCDVAETEWTLHARTLDFEDVLDCYVNEIENITDVHDKSKLIRNQLMSLLKIYVNVI